MRPALFALALLPVLAVAQPPAKFRSESGKFAAQFPGKPTEEKKPIRPGSETMIHLTKAAAPDGDRMVMWNEIRVKGFEPAKLLAEAAKGIGSRGKVVSEKATTFGPDRQPARELVVDSADGPRLRYLLLTGHDRLYQVVAVGSNEFVASPAADDFLKSFELLK